MRRRDAVRDNELDEADARALVSHGVIAVVEGANMPVTRAAARVLEAAGVVHAPGKAANAGGVAVSGLEQSQNAMRTSWSAEEVDTRLVSIMNDIHGRCVRDGATKGRVDDVKAANLAGLRTVANTLAALRRRVAAVVSVVWEDSCEAKGFDSKYGRWRR